MKCHYETLGISLDADTSQVKFAYRKLALKWHPDKNPNNPEATEQFKLVQSAYDVLSDPQEKAWYDRHRDDILHQQEFGDFDENSINFFDYFTTSCYRGFGPDAKSFFAVYSDLFAKISQQDERFRDDDDDDVRVPVFGRHDSDYDEVVHVFYGEWQSYSTKLSYVWKDKYDVKDAPNRRVARLITKENKKERDKKRKERNEIVQELVRFVRKRDPRVARHTEMMKQHAEEQRIKNEEKRIQGLRERLEEAAEYEEKNRHLLQERNDQLDQLEAKLKDEFGFSSNDEDEEEDDDDVTSDDVTSDDDDEVLFCVACNKNFKTPMAMKNHEKSKKHREKINLLKLEMMGEMEEIDDTGSEQEQKKKKKKKAQLFDDDDVVDDVTDEQAEVESLDDVTQAEEDDMRKQQRKKKKKNKKKNKLFHQFVDDVTAEVDDVTQSDVDEVTQPKVDDVTQPEVDDVTLAEVDDVTQSQVDDVTNEQDDDVTLEQAEVESLDDVTQSKKGKKKRRRKKNGDVTTTTTTIASDDVTMSCSTCKNNFGTRNKLFKHLKKTGHAANK